MNSNTNDQANTNVNPAQVQNYITWINSHLKKRPGVRLVENLHIDITNGVPLIHLIEVISGDVLADVNLNPKSYNEYKENIDKVLKFMQQNSVKIARTTSKEILDGNIKSIMRVILALAAHFKPSNLQSAPSVSTHSSSAANRHSAASLTGPVSTCSLNNLNKPTNSNTNNILTQQNSKHNLNSTRTITNIDSMTHLVQAACVSFADVRRYKNENFNVKYVRRNNLLLNGQPTPALSGGSSSYTALTSNNTTSTKQQHSSKFNLTTTICPTNTNSTDAVPSANILETNNQNINNRTYVTSQNLAQFDTLPNTSCKQADETNNFLNSVLLSPSSQQNPIASSTILSQTLPQAKQMEKEEKPNNKTYSKLTAQFVLENSKPNLDINSMNKQNSAVNTPNDDQFECAQNDQLEVVPELLDDVKCLKSVLLNLQNMLMNGDLKDFEKISDFVSNCYGNELNKNEEETNDENTNSSNSYSNSSNNDSMDNEFALANLSKDEQIAILRSKIQQLEIVCNDLRSELNQTKCESMNNCGLQNGLKSRLTELDNSMLEMKSEQLNLQLSNQHLLKEKEKCISLLDLQVAEINKLKAELIARDETIDKMKLEMNSLLKTDLLKKQMKNIADIEEIQEKESVLSGLIANRKLCIIDSKLSGAKKTDATFIVNKNKQQQQQQQPTVHTAASTAKPIMTDEETTALRDTLNQLRHNFKPSHPSLFLIDTLEERILAISERSNTNLADSEIEIMNFVSAKSNNTVPVPNSIGLITSSTSSINSSSSTSSNSSSLASSSANSPVLSTINQFQTNISQPQTCTIYTAMNQPSSFQRFQPSLSTTNTNLKRIEITKTHKNGEVELPIVNNSEQTNVKKIISRLLSQNSTSGGGNSISSTVSTTSNLNQQGSTHYLKKKNDSEFISSSSTHPIEKMHNLIGKSSSPSPMLLTISSSGSVATSTSSSSSSNHSPASSSSSSNSSIANMNHQTKCIYFKNKEVTPYMTSILKGVKNVTLRDFKERISKQLDNTKRYRFYFKSHEPEFGYLKEEITNDNTLLPTFENQIVAWVIENE